jgi:hypothetical protein
MMETVNSAVNAASRAIWGDGKNTTTEAGHEPISGQTGNTSNGEPYDAGNIGGKFSSPISPVDSATQMIEPLPSMNLCKAFIISSSTSRLTYLV